MKVLNNLIEIYYRWNKNNKSSNKSIKILIIFLINVLNKHLKNKMYHQFNKMLTRSQQCK